MTTICLSKYFDGSCEATIAANSLQLLPLLPCLPVLLTTKLAYCSLRSSFTVEKPWKAFFAFFVMLSYFFLPSFDFLHYFDFKVMLLQVNSFLETSKKGNPTDSSTYNFFPFLFPSRLNQTQNFRFLDKPELKYSGWIGYQRNLQEQKTWQRCWLGIYDGRFAMITWHHPFSTV